MLTSSKSAFLPTRSVTLFALIILIFLLIIKLNISIHYAPPHILPWIPIKRQGVSESEETVYNIGVTVHPPMQDGRLYACIRSSPALHGRSERLYTSKEAAIAAVST